MLIAALKTLMLIKYSGYSVYFHNFSHFDSIFVLKILVNMDDIKVTPTIRDGKILKLHVQFDKRTKKTKSGVKYQGSINIFDSLLILPTSLDKLGKSFKTEIKGFFPLKILNDPTISLDYEGEVPQLKYFYHPNILKFKEYMQYVSKYNAFKASFKGKNGVPNKK
jgi:hypothetical protein